MDIGDLEREPQGLPEGAKVWQFSDETDDPLEVVLRSIEADVNASGWNQRPKIALVTRPKVRGLDTRTNETVEIRAHAVQEVPMFPSFYADPALALPYWIHMIMTDAATALHLWTMIPPDKQAYYGWMLIVETWMTPRGEEISPEDLAKIISHKREPIIPSQSAERREGRLALLAVPGRVMELIRIRIPESGLDEIELLDSGAEEPKGTNLYLGCQMTALAAITAALAKMPLGELAEHVQRDANDEKD